jgi:uncharacterized protein
VTVSELRRFAVTRSLFPPTTLGSAVHALGYVQADPIRAPARAQDLILRHRVRDYRAGDLERCYSDLGIEEDYFINYGFVTASLHALMHPRRGFTPWPPTQKKRARAILDFVRERGVVHPREVDDHFAHGTTRNYWGGTSNATTHLLDAMHYRGLLRVAGRSAGIRLYAAKEEPQPADRLSPDARLDALVDALAAEYSPMPAASLRNVVGRLRFCVPQWRSRLPGARVRAEARLAHQKVDGTDWYWPANESPVPAEDECRVRLLAPFDPLVWDRRRFEMFWGWAYRFEAYTPAAKRKLGYYALPLLWRDAVIGWGNLSVTGGKLVAEFSYVNGRRPGDGAFRRALADEMDRMSAFLDIEQLVADSRPETIRGQ